MSTLTRRTSAKIGAGAVITVVAHWGSPIPAFATASEQADRTAARAAAVKNAATLVTQFRQQEAIDLLMPYAGDNDDTVFAGIASAYSQFGNSPLKLKAVEWISKAIDLKPTNTSYLASRAGYYGDAGYRFNDLRLADRQKVVDLAEAASPTKAAAPGNYSDLASAQDAFTVPRGGGLVDQNWLQKAIANRSRAIELAETYSRLLDRAELFNSRRPDSPDLGRNDVTRAIMLVEAMDPSSPDTWYVQGQLRRRVAALSTSMSLLGATITAASGTGTGAGVPEQFRPTVGAYRQQSVDYYQKYIDEFNAAAGGGVGLKAALLKRGSGTDAISNQASTLRSLGGTVAANSLAKGYHQQAVDNMTILININPMNHDYYRNRAISRDALDERGAAAGDYRKFLELIGSEDNGNVTATVERLRLEAM